LLDVATRSADLLVATFGPGRRSIWPGHQITEMGLAKLYRATGKREYLDLAKFLLDCRGGSGEYWQAHKPVLEQDEAVGHAVRASYMYAGMADVAAMTGDENYLRAIIRIWDNVVGRKLYITGGIGATGAGEAFGRDFQLPNMTAYAETCAAIGNVYWNHRLFLLLKDARHIDVLERTLYNGLLSGVSLDGKAFFYPNPLESTGQHARSPWFGVACCPGNMTRFIASVPGYLYASEGRDLYVNLYAAGTARVELEGTGVTVTQQTDYPWDGDVRLEIRPESETSFALKLRIPGWAREQAVPGNLYTFAASSPSEATIRINGERVDATANNAGYVTLSRAWRSGDVVEMSIPMPVRMVNSHPNVADNEGRVAIQRGPLVYCAEGADNGGSVRNLLLVEDAAVAAEPRADLLGGVTVVRASAQALAHRPQGGIERKPVEMTLIPYFAWANRGRGEMMVWIPNREENARPTPLPTLASRARVRASEGQNPAAINDLAKPLSATDQSVPFFHWWPKKGTLEWVEMTLDEESSVSEATVYWFDDTGRGECRVPQSWRLLYRDGEEWKPVSASTPFGTAEDSPNRIAFSPVETRQLRLEVQLQPRWSAGLYEWEVR
jgi:uncharacterized protein